MSTLFAPPAPALSIGPLALAVPVVLAPMAGITNTAFRRLCREYGAGLYVSEMITSRALVERTPESMRLIRHHESETPRSIQLYGVDPKTVAEAVTMLVAEDRADHIDLNFGCPVPKVTRKGGGAALPWKTELFRAIVEGAVKAAGPLPLTVKMRKGIDSDHLTYLEAGRVAEGAGVAAVALHARTAAEFYSGTADWSAIAKLKQTVTSVPVLGNGDIWSATDAVRMVQETGCDGVVVGRGCLGRPWLFGDLAAAFAPPGGSGSEPGERVETLAQPTLGEVAIAFRRHAELLVEFFDGDENHACRDIRKHVAWYFKGYAVGGETRAALAQASSLAEIDELLGRLDAEQPYPGADAEGQRGRAGTPKQPALPERWLDSRELQETHRATLTEAELDTSGGWLAVGYTTSDAERMLPEEHSTRRSDFARDRARILHSSALRRLAVKTQVLSPTAGLDFARNRLTHSLEVAQVGRELAVHLGLDPDVVDTACLAHDLGHPPYGHNGERALNDWARDIGGFEGNAQTLRLLTRLEPKVFGADDRAYGLNLTRASLDASCKYPWPEQDGIPDPSGRSKFGFYADDTPAFVWLRAGAPPRVRCIEAQVMDLSDDIAYSVHDFEDAIITGYLDVPALSARVEHDALVDSMVEWIGGEFDHATLIAAFDRLDNLPDWIDTWDGSRRDLARLKNLTSQLIGRFAGESVRATREAYPSSALARFGADVVVPVDTRAEIAVLKGIVAANVMSTNARKPIYARQRGILSELADALWADPSQLDAGFSADFAAAADDTARRRVIVDQVASLTDPSANAWHERLVS